MDPKATGIEASIFLHRNGTEAYVHELVAEAREKTESSPLRGRSRAPVFSRYERVWIVDREGEGLVTENHSRQRGVVSLDRLQIGQPGVALANDEKALGASAALEKANSD